MIFIMDHIHHLMNEFKILIFAYNSNRRVYFSTWSISSIMKCNAYLDMFSTNFDHNNFPLNSCSIKIMLFWKETCIFICCNFIMFLIEAQFLHLSHVLLQILFFNWLGANSNLFVIVFPIYYYLYTFLGRIIEVVS